MNSDDSRKLLFGVVKRREGQLREVVAALGDLIDSVLDGEQEQAKQQAEDAFRMLWDTGLIEYYEEE